MLTNCKDFSLTYRTQHCIFYKLIFYVITP